MDFNGLEWIWKSALIIVGGIILLRIAGRKSISQMTLAQTVIMIGIGSLLIQPLAGKNIWTTLYVGALLVASLIIVEYIQLKFDVIEQIVTGKSKVLIENGNLKINNLRNVRLTVDQLETQLRLKGISKITDVKWGTIEPNGQLAFVQKNEFKNATKQDIDTLRQELVQIKQLLNNVLPSPQPNAAPSLTQVNQWSNNETSQLIQKLTKQVSTLQSQLKSSGQDIFQEVNTETHTVSPPKHLQ